jgi:hypothetical protein
LRIRSDFGPFPGKLDFHRLPKYRIPIQTIFRHHCLINLPKHHKRLAPHPVIFLTHNLTDLAVSFKQEIKGVLEILRLYLLVYVVDVQRLLWLLGLRGLFDVAGLLVLVLADHCVSWVKMDVLALD